MNRSLFFILVLCLGFLRSQGAEPQAAPSGSAAPVIDAAQVSDHYRQVLQRPEFEDTGEADTSTRLKEWLSQWFTHLGAQLGQFKYNEEMPALTSLIMTGMVLFCLTVLLYVIFRLVRRRSELESLSPEESPGQKIFRSPEFYDKEIEEAVRARDWHTAWMTIWRQFLSRLENQHLVVADRTRTNREYLAQLRDQTLPSSALTLLMSMVDAYDRFIYGRKNIGESEWDAFHQQINEAALLLHLHDKRPGLRLNPGAA